MTFVPQTSKKAVQTRTAFETNFGPNLAKDEPLEASLPFAGLANVFWFVCIN
jgi:hypothetical protein